MRADTALEREIQRKRQSSDGHGTSVNDATVPSQLVHTSWARGTCREQALTKHVVRGACRSCDTATLADVALDGRFFGRAGRLSI